MQERMLKSFLVVKDLNAGNDVQNDVENISHHTITAAESFCEEK